MMLAMMLLATVVATSCGTAKGASESTPSAVADITLQPQAVRLLPPGNDPRVIKVTVHWIAPGWCVGEFHASATETGNEVVIGPVVRHVDPAASCLGIGSGNNTAWAELTLTEPFGNRTPVRASDGVVLPIEQET